MTNKELNLIAMGRVQGVGFRFSVKGYCDRFGICGYVQNLEDGDVRIVAQADEEVLVGLISWLKKSPGFSKVVDIKEKWFKVKDKFSEFKIVRSRGFINDQKSSFVNLTKEIIQ